MSLNMKKIPNSINTLRYLAAFQVMWGHMIVHLSVNFLVLGGGFNLDQIISSVLYFFMGVPLFFFLSGYLIWFSVKRTHDSKEYYKKRFFRIYPELWVGIIINILTIIIFYREKIQWFKLGLFALAQGTILQFWTPEFLRGYGCGTPNGSLWTICVMVQFYIIIWMARKLLYKRKILFWIISTTVFMAIGACTGFVEGKIPDVLYKLYCQTIVQYLWIFFLGVMVAEYIDNLLPLLKKYWWISIPIFVVWNILKIDIYSRNYPIFMTIVSCLGCLGFAYKFPEINIKTDISYAIFIYHMIFVNIAIELGMKENIGMFIITIIGTLIVSYLSTITIGKYSSKFRIRLMTGD